MKLRCVCGKALNVPSDMVGRQIRCKGCGKVLTVRTASGSTVEVLPGIDPDDPLSVKDHRPCPTCGRAWPTKDKFCTVCGTDMETGAALYTSLDKSGEPMPEPPTKKGFVAKFLRLFGKKGH